MSGDTGTPGLTDRPADISGPAVILCEPQMGENIGATARAMANFGLSDLRLVAPRDGWPNEKADANAAKALHIIRAARVYARVEEAVADCAFVYATTARDRDVTKEVRGPVHAARHIHALDRQGARVGLLFGRERWGLNNDEVALADEILTLPVVPDYASLNIAQAVLVVAYEWRKAGFDDPDAALPFGMSDRSPPATKQEVLGLFEHLETELDDRRFFRPVEKRPVMIRNLRAIFQRRQLTLQEVKTLRGVITALTGRKHRRPADAGSDAPGTVDQSEE